MEVKLKLTKEYADIATQLMRTINEAFAFENGELFIYYDSIRFDLTRSKPMVVMLWKGKAVLEIEAPVLDWKKETLEIAALLGKARIRSE